MDDKSLQLYSKLSKNNPMPNHNLINYANITKQSTNTHSLNLFYYFSKTS